VIFFGVLVLIGAEIAAFVAVADQVGFLWALLILIGVSALGPFVVKRVGFGVLVHTQERLARGEVPTRELFDGLVVLAAGVLICVPGFIGDALGLLLMIGPVRHPRVGTTYRPTGADDSHEPLAGDRRPRRADAKRRALRSGKAASATRAGQPSRPLRTKRAVR
jgi:UPF0716 family protein affecting phage T7 exclusion